MIIIIFKKNFCVLNRCSSLLTSVHNCLFLTLALSWPNFSEASFFPVDPQTLLVCTTSTWGQVSPPLISFSWKSPDHRTTSYENSLGICPCLSTFPVKDSAYLHLPQLYPVKENSFCLILRCFQISEISIFLLLTVFLLNKAFSYLSPNLGCFFFYLVFNYTSVKLLIFFQKYYVRQTDGFIKEKRIRKQTMYTGILFMVKVPF